MKGFAEYESSQQCAAWQRNCALQFNTCILNLYKISGRVYHMDVTHVHLPFYLSCSQGSLDSMNDDMSRNKISRTKFLWLVCYPQLRQNNVFRTIYFTAQNFD